MTRTVHFDKREASLPLRQSDLRRNTYRDKMKTLLFSARHQMETSLHRAKRRTRKLRQLFPGLPLDDPKGLSYLKRNCWHSC
jgi:hypothetical protein